MNSAHLDDGAPTAAAAVNSSNVALTQHTRDVLAVMHTATALWLVQPKLNQWFNPHEPIIIFLSVHSE